MNSPKFLQVYREYFDLPKTYELIRRVDVSEYELVAELKDVFTTSMFGENDLKEKL